MIWKKPLSMQDRLREVDLVFVIDATSSMSGEIREVQQRLKDFAIELAKADVRPIVSYGIVAYRDHPPQDRTYVTQVFDLSDDIRAVQENIDALRAEGGGDGPEAVVDGIHDAVQKIGWRTHSHKVIILVGDAPPHGLGATGDTFPEGCPNGFTIESVTTQAVERGIIIYAVGVRDSAEMIKSFTRIAERTKGEFVPLSDVNALIERVLSLLEIELGKVSDDIQVHEAVSAGKTLAEIARDTGKSGEAVTESIDRLRMKDALPDEASEAVLREMDARTAGTAGRVRILSPTRKSRVKVLSPPDGNS